MYLRTSQARACVLLSATALCGALAVAAGPAAAQTAGASTSSNTSSTVGEIVVTAQRRAERLQDVPVTVTAVSGAKLSTAGVGTSGQLEQVVPAFRMDYSGAFAQPNIRGVTTAIANIGAGSNVGVYIDGFYDPSPLSSDFDFVNVSNVQVLKGPQGTLFGRNTTGGAILVTTSDPSWKPGLQANVSYGNYNTLKTGFYATGPLNDKIAGDISLKYDSSDGYLTNVVDNNNKAGRNQDVSFRVGLKFDLGDNNSVLIRYSHSRKSDPEYNFDSVYAGPSTAVPSLGITPLTGGQTIANPALGLYPGAKYGAGFGQVASECTAGSASTTAFSGGCPGFHSWVDQGTITGKFDLGWATLTSNTMMRNEWSRQDLDVDNSSAQTLDVSFDNIDHTETQEFLLNSKPNGKYDWVTGFFYMNQIAGEDYFDYTQFFGAGPAGNGLGFPGQDDGYATHVNIMSYALFADGDYHFGNFVADLGGRVSYEKDMGYDTIFPLGQVLEGAVVPSASDATPGVHKAEGDWTNFQPRASLRYEIDRQQNVYFTFSKGFKAGFVDVNSFTGRQILPERITSYEVGYKLQTPATRVDLSTYYYNYRNLQVSDYSGTYSFTTNAPLAEIYGAEFSGSQRLTHELTLSGGVAWTHARYIDYPAAPFATFDNNSTSASYGQIVNLTNPPGCSGTACVGASGLVLQRAPEWTGNVALDYTHPLAGGKVDFNANWYFTSKFYFDQADHYVQPSYNLLSLHATWTEPQGHWSFTLFGDNVTDTHYYSQVLPNGYAAGATWGAPAMYGVAASYKY